jgi:hypothetical protein
MSPLPNTSGTPATPARATETLKPSLTPPPGFREVALQPMKAWDAPGQQVAGYFLGIRPSTQFAGRKLLDMVDDDGIVTTWPCPVLLEQLLLGVQARTALFIHYRGAEKTTKGETKHFDLALGDVK